MFGLKLLINSVVPVLFISGALYGGVRLGIAMERNPMGRIVTQTIAPAPHQNSSLFGGMFQ